ncbi:MAG: hypothetical protein AB1629_04440 [Candidatus Omnitrophota bacterium]
MEIKDFALEQIGLAQEDSLDDRKTAFLLALKHLTNDGDNACSGHEIKKVMESYLDIDEMDFITTSWIGYRIREFKLNKNKQRLRQGYLYSLKKVDVEDIIERYLGSAFLTPENPTHPTNPTYPTLV